eukprot:TRINITY_DN94959_c0_g1_i1.p1 TRINITY_DN94959_c0_g1~~TRINITY_DN94959_c0_g1_i1.p1  ORF type:complete len:244 (+),score=49.99 TRINITY_DN94959_c0_g1_i1:99-734(+)
MAAPQEWLNDYVTQFMKSPSWSGPLKNFIEENCCIFDFTNPEENKLEYTDVHNAFKELVDSLLAAHLLEVDITPEAFAASYDALAQDDPQFNSITEQLVSVADFLVFRNMMMTRSRTQQQVVDTSYVKTISIAAGKLMPESDCPHPPPPAEESSELKIGQLPTPARVPLVKKADRIAAIVSNATRPDQKHDAQERAAMVRSALAELLIKKK